MKNTMSEQLGRRKSRSKLRTAEKKDTLFITGLGLDSTGTLPHPLF